MQQIFDDICPVQSGRDYTCKGTSTDYLYKLYESTATAPMGKTSFYQMVNAARIRNTVQTQCPHCIKYKAMSGMQRPLSTKDQRVWTQEEFHSRVWLPQRRHYCAEKESCQTSDDAVLIVMDFAKIDVYHHSFQILHIIYYFRGENGAPAMRLSSFIGQVKEKNDLYFVINVYLEHVIPMMLQRGWKRVRIFSDGGSKHFKCSPFLFFMWSMWHFYKVLDIEYHFFASYHGCNGCDGAAAQAAAKVRAFQAETGVYPHTADDLLEILETIQNHNYTVIPRIERLANKKPKEFIQIDTFVGIRSYHRFTFHANHQITAYPSSSADVTPNVPKTWQKRPTQFPEYAFPKLLL